MFETARKLDEKKKNKEARITFRCQEELREKILKLCFEHECSKSHLISVALDALEEKLEKDE